MNFCSHSFILLFLPASIFLYYFAYKTKGLKASKFALLMLCVIFYAFSGIKPFCTLLAECLITYLSVRKARKLKDDGTIEIQKNFSVDKMILALIVIMLISVLLVFKYNNFFIESINSVLGTGVSALKIIVPLGISYFTFQQIAFAIDYYRGEIPEVNLLDYLVFSFLFITITSGPIVYYNEIIPQINDERSHKVDYDKLYRGFVLFCIGLSKKVLVANVFAQAVNNGYEVVYAYGTVSAVLLSLCYTFQIYFDFSGYCDMGMGIAWMIGIDLPLNFDSPYKSYSIAEFWDRWHITLTRFFTKYLYIPLGGSRRGTIRTYINVLIIFFISGVWHGADYKFIIWGMLHGIAMVMYRYFKKYFDKWHQAFKWLVTFSFVNTAWGYFGAPTISHANTLISKLIGFQGESSIHESLSSAFYTSDARILSDTLGLELMEKSPNMMILLYMAISFYVILNCENSCKYVKEKSVNIGCSAIVALLAFWSVCSLTGVINFVYFNF